MIANPYLTVILKFVFFLAECGLQRYAVPQPS